MKIIINITTGVIFLIVLAMTSGGLFSSEFTTDKKNFVSIVDSKKGNKKEKDFWSQWFGPFDYLNDIITDKGIPEKKKDRESIFPKNKTYTLEIFLSSGISSGSVGEYVFNGVNKLSYLDWDFRPLFYFGGGLTFRIKSTLIIYAGFWGSIPAAVGTMEDYDWRTPGVLTEYSKHNSYLKNGFFGDINVRMPVKVLKKLKLSIGLGYRFKYMDFVARYGYLDYDLNLVPDAFAVSDPVISYQQMIHIPYYVIMISGKLSSSISLSAALFYSPFVIVDAVDIHHNPLKYFRFHDVVVGAKNIKGEFGLSWKIGPIALQFKIFFENTFLARGTTQETNLTTGYASPAEDGSGISYTAVNYELSVICTLF